jgi:transcriptional regulator with XRE-family HTH domain
MWFAGMNRNRSKFGKWLDSKGVSQSEISRRSGVSDATVNNLATGKSKKPTRLTERKLRRALKEIDPKVRSSDFWDV